MPFIGCWVEYDTAVGGAVHEVAPVSDIETCRLICRSRKVKYFQWGNSHSSGFPNHCWCKTEVQGAHQRSYWPGMHVGEAICGVGKYTYSVHDELEQYAIPARGIWEKISP